MARETKGRGGGTGGQRLKKNSKYIYTKEISHGYHTVTVATPTTVNDVNGWTQIMDELNATLIATDPVISKLITCSIQGY